MQPMALPAFRLGAPRTLSDISKCESPWQVAFLSGHHGSVRYRFALMTHTNLAPSAPFEVILLVAMLCWCCSILSFARHRFQSRPRPTLQLRGFRRRGLDDLSKKSPFLTILTHFMSFHIISQVAQSPPSPFSKMKRMGRLVQNIVRPPPEAPPPKEPSSDEMEVDSDEDVQEVQRVTLKELERAKVPPKRSLYNFQAPREALSKGLGSPGASRPLGRGNALDTAAGALKAWRNVVRSVYPPGTAPP